MTWHRGASFEAKLTGASLNDYEILEPFASTYKGISHSYQIFNPVKQKILQFSAAVGFENCLNYRQPKAMYD
jgi:hypothetical protein